MSGVGPVDVTTVVAPPPVDPLPVLVEPVVPPELTPGAVGTLAVVPGVVAPTAAPPPVCVALAPRPLDGGWALPESQAENPIASTTVATSQRRSTDAAYR